MAGKISISITDEHAAVVQEAGAVEPMLLPVRSFARLSGSGVRNVSWESFGMKALLAVAANLISQWPISSAKPDAANLPVELSGTSAFFASGSRGFDRKLAIHRSRGSKRC